MKNEYYGVVSSNDFMAHYGIKGMKWGVRKAIEKSNAKALEKQYRKASKKLEKLSKKSDVNKQQELSKRYGKAAAVGLGIAGAGIGGAVGSSIHAKNMLGKMKNLTSAHKALGDELDNITSRQIRDAERRLRLTAQGGKYNSYRYPYERDMAFDKLGKDFNEATNKDWENYKSKSDLLKKDLDKANASADRAIVAGKVAQDVGVAALLASGVAGVKSAKAKYRTTEKGHAKAVQELNAWKKQMNEAFKGTKYEGLPTVQSKRKAKRK